MLFFSAFRVKGFFLCSSPGWGWGILVGFVARVEQRRETGLGCRGLEQFTVEARKLEHHYPHALKVKYKGS